MFFKIVIGPLYENRINCLKEKNALWVSYNKSVA